VARPRGALYLRQRAAFPDAARRPSPVRRGGADPGRGDTSVTRFGPGCHFADRPSV